MSSVSLACDTPSTVSTIEVPKKEELQKGPNKTLEEVMSQFFKLIELFNTSKKLNDFPAE